MNVTRPRMFPPRRWHVPARMAVVAVLLGLIAVLLPAASPGCDSTAVVVAAPMAAPAPCTDRAVHVAPAHCAACPVMIAAPAVAVTAPASASAITAGGEWATGGAAPEIAPPPPRRA